MSSQKTAHACRAHRSPFAPTHLTPRFSIQITHPLLFHLSFLSFPHPSVIKSAIVSSLPDNKPNLHIHLNHTIHVRPTPTPNPVARTTGIPFPLLAPKKFPPTLGIYSTVALLPSHLIRQQRTKKLAGSSHTASNCSPPNQKSPQGGFSTYDQGRLSRWVSDNSYPNHPKPSGDHKRSATPKHTKASPDPKHTKTPKHGSSFPGNDTKHVVTQKGKKEHRPEKARAERLVCDFCKRGTPIWLDDGRSLCDGCYSYRQGRIAGR